MYIVKFLHSEDVTFIPQHLWEGEEEEGEGKREGGRERQSETLQILENAGFKS